MHGLDFWTQSAEAMELAAEGDRLIANEVARGMRNFGRRAINSLDELLEGLGKPGHLPPV